MFCLRLEFLKFIKSIAFLLNQRPLEAEYKSLM